MPKHQVTLSDFACDPTNWLHGPIDKFVIWHSWLYSSELYVTASIWECTSCIEYDTMIQIIGYLNEKDFLSLKYEDICDDDFVITANIDKEEFEATIVVKSPRLTCKKFEGNTEELQYIITLINDIREENERLENIEI